MKKKNQKSNRRVKNQQGRKFGCVIISMFLVMILGACSLLEGNDDIVAEEITDEVEELDTAPIMLDDPEEQEGNQSEEIMEFSVELLAILQDESQDNILISPYSILTALAMTANGAQGETLEQMEAIFGTDIDSLNQFFYAYRSGYLPSDEGYKVNVANSIWLKDDDSLLVQEEFLEMNKTYYRTNVYKASFDETTLTDINAWVSKETDGMVEDMLDEIHKDAIMYLVNAVSFQAEWDTIYKKDQIREMEFIAESGEVQEVEFLCGDEYGYIELDDACGFSKPYQDDKYSFIAILPDGNMEEFIKELDGSELLKAIEQESREKVITYLPKFSMEYGVELVETLMEMGMEEAFLEEEADFTQMATSGNGNIYINRVLHKTFITVDEKGTEAGASTVVEMTTESTSVKEPKIVCLDRPFLFMIVDNELHVPIFMGVVESVE